MSLDYNIELLAQPPNSNDTLSVTLYYQKFAAEGNKKRKNEQRENWQKQNTNKPIEIKAQTLFEGAFEKPDIDLEKLPPYSWVIQFTFTLAQPYISRDESDFYIIDNPVRKDKVFGLPYVAPTSWKGSLRAAARRIDKGHADNSPEIVRLFGTEKKDDHESTSADFEAGRLHFFPTFFKQKSLEIINPHDRSRRVGKDPILIESVPKGATGIFTLLYVPFNSSPNLPIEAANDLKLAVEALRAMLCEYGFGAKTSSGFGLAKSSVDVDKSFLTLRAENLVGQPSAIAKPDNTAKPSQNDLARYLENPETLKAEYLTDEGVFRELTSDELNALTKSDRQVYDKAKNWWNKEGKDFAEKRKSAPPAPVEVPSTPKAPTPKVWPKWTFDSFDKLQDHVKTITSAIKEQVK